MYDCVTQNYFPELGEFGLPKIAFVQAKNYSPKPLTPRRIVIHTMECLETMTAAENVAKWFASAAAPQASAHWCVDADSIVQCVRSYQVAWHAGKANPESWGIEHAGYARQTPADWADEYSQRMLELSARLAGHLASTEDIPAVRLTPEQVRAGEKGFCGHIDVTKAFDVKGGHWDPGPNFPWDSYLARVEQVASHVRAAGAKLV
jgi:N-acetyl-anhydromuramyl-L-alanine amidase AmpD